MNTDPEPDRKRLRVSQLCSETVDKFGISAEKCAFKINSQQFWFSWMSVKTSGSPRNDPGAVSCALGTCRRRGRPWDSV